MRTGANSGSAADATSAIRRALATVLAETVVHRSSALGYTITGITFGQTCEVTLEKQGATFSFWLLPADDEGPCYRRTARFKLGYAQDPPDRLGYALLQAVCAGIESWERTLPDGAHAPIFDRVPAPAQAAPGDIPTLDATTAARLSEAAFSLIYGEWLDVREAQLAARFERLNPGRKNVLLVNATSGLQFYPSIVDFFALLGRIHQGFRTTGASHFESIVQFHRDVADKGLPVVPVADLMQWDAAEFNRFDVILLIGAGDVLLKLMALEGITAKLVLLDLGFYHQLLESHPGWYPGAGVADDKVLCDESSQRNALVGYSCQPKDKVAKDLAGVCSPVLLEWRWFNYIPIGFRYRPYYRSDRNGFDVGLLGRGGRDYRQIDPRLFRGMRFLFLGNAENAPDIDRLRAELDVTVVSRVDEDTYSRLLALCRCVVLPAHVHHLVNNVFLSVVDTLASGRPLVTPRHVGLARLEEESVPSVFYDNTSPPELFARVSELLQRPGHCQEIEAQSIAFAQERLDIYRILAVLLEEEIL